MAVLPVLFVLTAAIYASVGFGGGSTYNALLVLSDVDYRILPSIALVCNIAVVAGGTWRFARAGHIRLPRILPFIITSVPAAWVGGRLQVSETFFIALLATALLVSGIYLLLGRSDIKGAVQATCNDVRYLSASGFGAGLGFLAGITGIGGGIFLAPMLYALRWGPPKQIAGAASIFILVNSIAGLLGQVAKLHDIGLLSDTVAYWPLLPAVLVGGQVGSILGSGPLPASLVQRGTAVLILFVAGRLILSIGKA